MRHIQRHCSWNILDAGRARADRMIESASEKVISVRSRFHMIELRRDNLRYFAVTCRLDMLNAQAPVRLRATDLGLN
jgi:hypothetical protein